ncbi:HAD hydrolase-like protein [Mollicutes bacterium LVI A0039]|nr:HAD hydrolase-like protein [Mollicutes bacterium LVI A0039]
MNRKAVLLDFDGVVIESDILHYQFNKIICDKYDLAYNYDNYIKYHKGKKSNYFFDEMMLSRHMNHNDFLSQKHIYITRKISECEINEDVYNALAYAYVNNIPVFLNSSNTKALEYLKLLNMNHFITADVLDYDKSKPESYLSISKKYDYKPEQLIALEDSDNIIKIMKEVKINVIKIPATCDIIEILCNS